MKVKILFITLLFSLTSYVLAQQFSANTSYTWDLWQTNQWAYVYSNGWCYAVEGKPGHPTGNARDFYFRFNYNELLLREFTKKEWKEIKKNDGWIQKSCTFEYYITDKYPTLKSALTAHSWPCAKAYLDSRKPAVLKTERVITKVYYTDDDEVRTLNFWIDGCGFAITVHWDYMDYDMRYGY
ncbi:MAG: hypothetical protein K6E73_07690 [Bacteroidales bacterium]|nr:hypothetical protein [Bacteroidales bacterium]